MTAIPIADRSASEKLPWWRKVGYGLGDIYGGGSGVVISFYYLVFLTDVVRISPGLAGTVILISKLYDALTDPFEGLIADRTRTRLGRRRPYLLAGIPLVFLSFLALFYPVTFESETGRFLFVIATYLFFSTVVSIVMLNYNALQAELSLDYDERTSLSSARILFSTLSSIVAALLPPEIVGLFDDVRSGYIAMSLFFGLFFALPFVVTILTTRERAEFQKAPEPINWHTLLAPFRVRTFVYTLMMYLLAFVAIDTVSSIVVYFMKNYLGRGDEANLVSGTLLVAQVVSLPFYVWLSRRTDKRTGYILGAASWVVTMLFSFVITPAAPDWAVYAFAVVVGLATGGIVIMIYAIFPDIPDVDELESGRRREGTYSAVFTFMRKASSALALFLVANSLAAAGYLPPVEEVVDGATRLVEQPQSETFILALRLIFALVPILLLALALLFAARFPLTAGAHRRLRAVLDVTRAGRSLTPQEGEEAVALRRLLIGPGKEPPRG